MCSLIFCCTVLFHSIKKIKRYIFQPVPNFFYIKASFCVKFKIIFFNINITVYCIIIFILKSFAYRGSLCSVLYQDMISAHSVVQYDGQTIMDVHSTAQMVMVMQQTTQRHSPTSSLSVNPCRDPTRGPTLLFQAPYK